MPAKRRISVATVAAGADGPSPTAASGSCRVQGRTAHADLEAEGSTTRTTRPADDLLCQSPPSTACNCSSALHRQTRTRGHGHGTRAPFELTVFKVKAPVTKIIGDDDGDLHLVISGTHTMIAGAPVADCNTGATSSRRAQMKEARAAVRICDSPELTGVAFF